MDEPLYLKSPAATPAAGPDPAVSERVSEMLLRIERGGINAVREYSRELDDWDPSDFQVSDEQIAAAGTSLPSPLKLTASPHGVRTQPVKYGPKRAR